MLSDERDLIRMRDGVRRLRELGLHGGPRHRHARRLRLHRPLDRRGALATELDDWLFAECTDAQHASGTCRMGARDDPRSVVDPDCRVIGCTGLRVIDASVMPEVVRANTHLTTVMIAEKMADLLKCSGR